MKKNLSIIMGVLLVLAWYVTVSTWLGNEGKYQGYIEEAKRLEEKGLYLDALTQYGLAQELKPDSMEVDSYIADAYYALGDYKSYKNQLNNMIDEYGPVDSVVEKLFSYYETFSSQGSLISCVRDMYAEYPDNEIVQKYYNQLKGVYDTMFVSVNKIDKFKGSYAVFSLNDKMGILNTAGNIVVKAVYDEVYYNGEDNSKIIVKDNNKYYMINLNGYKTAEPDAAYESMGILLQGRISAKKDGKYGYLDSSMQEKIAFVYDDATAFSDGIAAVKQGDKWAFINTKGEAVTDFIYDEVAVNTKGSCSVAGVIGVRQGDDWFLINTEGERIGQDTYEGIKAFEGKGYTAVRKNERWGYINTEGTLVIDYQYHDAKSFTNGFAAVKSNGLWGFIDTNNLLIIDYTFSDAEFMTSKGVAAVAYGDVWTLIELTILN